MLDGGRHKDQTLLAARRLYSLYVGAWCMENTKPHVLHKPALIPAFDGTSSALSPFRRLEARAYSGTRCGRLPNLTTLRGPRLSSRNVTFLLEVGQSPRRIRYYAFIRRNGSFSSNQPWKCNNIVSVCFVNFDAVVGGV